MVTKITRDPNSGSQSSTTAAQQISTAEVGKQMCNMQADIKVLTKQSKDVIDINRAMLEEQQQMRLLTTSLLDSINGLVESTKAFMVKVEAVIDQTSEIVKENDKNTEALMEAIYEMQDENQINMEFMNGSIEVIAQAALTLAYIDGKDDAAVADAQAKATAEIVSNKSQNDAIRQYVRDLLSQQKADARKAKLDARKQ